MQNLSTSFSSFYSGSFLHLFRQGFQFLFHVYRTGKTTELVSFIGWELLYRMHYYPSSRTVKLTNSIPFTINEDGWLMESAGVSESNPDKRYAEPIAIDWKYCFQGVDSVVWGCEYGHDNVLIKTGHQSCLETIWSFPANIKSLYVTQKAIFVCAGGVLYRSPLANYDFSEVLKLTTSQSYFLFNNGFCELPDGTLLLGEYASIWQDNHWMNLAHLYISKDSGYRWKSSDFLKRQGVNKHIHLVKFSPLLNQVFLTDGDNRKQLWRNETLVNYAELAGQNRDGWQLINRFHWQMGGYTSMLDYGKGVVFGTDYLGGTNFLVYTNDGRTFRKEVMPNPYRRSPVINMVSRRVGDKTELWALLHNSVVPGQSCLLMYSTNNGESWHRFIEYDGRHHEIQLVSSSVSGSDELLFCIRQLRDGQEVSQTFRVVG